MRSSSVIAVCLLVLVACMSLSGLRGVSADGSIQPFNDEYCSSPIANATNVGVVSSPQCQWTTSGTNVQSFSYQCYPGQNGNFSLTMWMNANGPCNGVPDFSITTQFGSGGGACAVATYQDPNTNVEFYGQFYCWGNWPTAATAAAEEASAANKNLLQSLSSLIPPSPSSAIHRLAQQIEAGKQMQ